MTIFWRKFLAIFLNLACGIFDRHRFPLCFMILTSIILRIGCVPNSIGPIKFDFSTAVARPLKPSRATAV